MTWEKERRYSRRQGQRTEGQHIQKEGDSGRERDRQTEDAGESQGVEDTHRDAGIDHGRQGDDEK